MAAADFGLRMALLQRRSAAYHRAEVERARRLRSEATTRWLKEHLDDAIARHEQIAAEVERASEPDGASPLRQIRRAFKRNPRLMVRGPRLVSRCVN
jgi:hypothetical protein